ncbi:MAG: type II toxin-antitoxin system RelE/ParE family toxin [Dehalococcoidales bacterium]|nr:type II toxin-antitoxin system RelE/ParE family toxin [Dehalococcoidales bacterium]
MWGIEYYKAASGQIPVKEFIEALNVKERAKVARTIDLLEEFGINLGMPYAEHVEGELWELRARLSNNRYRIIYFLNTGQVFIMLHGFVKKTQKIPKSEIKIANKRLREYISRRRSEK